MSFERNLESGEGYNPSYGSGVAVAGASPAERAAFLNKVYVTLCGGVILAMGSAFWAASSPLVATLLIRGAMGWVIMFGLFIGLTYAVQAVAQKPGWNVAAFAGYTIATGVLLLSPMFYYAALLTKSYLVVWNAILLTGIVFGGLTGFVLITGKNFSFMGGSLFAGFWVLVAFTFGSIFFHSSAVQLAVTCGGLLLFCLFVLYNTSVIMNELSSDQWIMGALMMFINFINLFIRVLSLLLQLNRR